jgi:hypothetical protein
MSSRAHKYPLPPDAESIAGAYKNASEDEGHDWTERLPQTDHIRFFRDTDWTVSGLGPPQDWDDELRLFTGFVLADSRAACLWWGPDFIAVYNEAFAPLAAQVHPTLMGSTFVKAFPELWLYINTLIKESSRTGVGQNVSSAAPLLVERNGWTEEAFFSGSFVPIGPRHQPQGY